jgi:hypothetical protein
VTGVRADPPPAPKNEMNGNAFPMKRGGHREAACLGKAALKTHALQTLRDRRASPNRAKRLECVRLIGAFVRRGRFMVPMHSKKRKGAFHEPESEAGVSPAHWKKQMEPRKTRTTRNQNELESMPDSTNEGTRLSSLSFRVFRVSRFELPFSG